MVMVLGPTKNAGVAKDDAKDEDTQRSEEAVQGDGDGQAAAAPASPDDASRPPDEEVAQEAEARLRQGRAGRICATSEDASRSCSGRELTDATRQAFGSRAQEAPQGSRPRRRATGGSRSPRTATRRSRSSTRSLYAYRDRKNKKRTFRRLWIIRINAAARQNGLSYNQFMSGLREAEIPLDRKVLAELAVNDPQAFGAIAQQAKSALEAKA